jgi:hypothetical protein
MSPTQKAVLMALADNASDHGVCWPSIPTLCIKTCLAKSTVITALQALESAGLLVADRATGRVNKYQIVPTLDLFPKDKPVRQLDRSGSRTGTGAGPNPSGSRTGPVREPDPNHKEPSRTVTKSSSAQGADLDFSSWPSVPSPQVLADWLDVRKRKRAPVTTTAMRGMGAQLHRAAGLGFDVDAALTECVLRNWQGLNADWLQPNQHTPTGRTAAPSKTLTAIHRLEAMKDGLANRRTADRVPEVALLGTGSDTGD